jgi:hypothetical protein
MLYSKVSLARTLFFNQFLSTNTSTGICWRVRNRQKKVTLTTLPKCCIAKYHYPEHCFLINSHPPIRQMKFVVDVSMLLVNRFDSLVHIETQKQKRTRTHF